MSRVGLVHDYLTQRGGAERVALALTRAFPGAPLVTSLYEPGSTFPGFASVDVRVLPLNRVAPLRRRARAALPALAPSFAAAHVDADVVVCSSSGWAHLVRTSGRKIVYCHSPAKWLYRRDDYLGAHPSTAARLALGVLSPPLRRADRWGARSADVYVANSTYIAGQIEQVYGVDARVVHPPAGLDPDGAETPLAGLEPGFHLTVGRLLPYKHVDRVVEAFRGLPGERLVAVGSGPLEARLRAGLSANVTLLTDVDDAQLRWLYANCAALVAPSREDFGLTPVEAAGFGKPVAALRFGGYLDTVREGETGVFFDEPSPAAIREAAAVLAAASWDAGAIRAHAATFSEARFVEAMRELVTRA
jgi:glycosyltransferase involved in cell wall biosynthesis